MILGKKQSRLIFLFKLKMVIKQQRQFATSRMHLVYELLTNVQCSGGPRNSCKGDKSLEDDERSDWPLEVDNNQPEKLPKNSMWTILWSFSI